MNDLYTIVLEAAGTGSRVDIDLNRHSLAINGGLVIDSGQWQGDLGVQPTDEATALAQIEAAFSTYQVSTPEHSDRDRSRWFKAIREDQLTDEQLATGEDRPLARCRLEMLMLCHILIGSLTKDGPQMSGHWFWQSAIHQELVILADWLPRGHTPRPSDPINPLEGEGGAVDVNHLMTNH